MNRMFGFNASGDAQRRAYLAFRAHYIRSCRFFKVGP